MPNALNTYPIAATMWQEEFHGMAVVAAQTMTLGFLPYLGTYSQGLRHPLQHPTPPLETLASMDD